MEEDLAFFEIFPWNPNFETGIEIIDEQHKELVRILNKLAGHLANRSEDIVLNKIFDELANYADYHFRTEEKIWSSNFHDDEWFSEHEKTHVSFIDEVVALKNNDNNKPLDDVVYDIVSLLSKWLAYHILDTDKRMAIVVLNLQSGKSLEESKIISNDTMSGTMNIVIQTVLTMYDTLSVRTLDLMREKSLRKKAEKDLKRSEERWKFILESDSENVWDWDIENNKVIQSDNLGAISEITGSKLNNNSSKLSNIHPSDIDRVNKDFNAHIAGKTEFYVNKHRLVKDDGSWSWILSRAKIVNRSEDGTPLRVIGTHTDITEKELAKIVYENTSQAILTSNSKNQIISINNAFTKITGYSEKDSLGQEPSFLSSGMHDDEFYDEMWESINSTGHWSGQIYNRSKSGDILLAYQEINRVVDAEGNVDHYVSMFNDITQEEKNKQERQMREEYLIQLSRMAQMGEMISMIAHQWKQPLSAISSVSANLQIQLEIEKFDLTDKDERAKCQNYFTHRLQDIDKYIQGLATTMDDFRNFHNPNKRRTLTDISSPVIKALSIIKASLNFDGVDVYEDYKSKDSISIHENEIIQVLLNIFKNAQDNFKDSATINPKITISSKDIEKGCILKICDNGGGIPEDIIEKIFDPYFSTKNEKGGTGLGLYMSKTIIESHHNGRLHAQNMYNTEKTAIGTCFIIELDDIKV